MTSYNLDRVLRPASIAVIEARIMKQMKSPDMRIIGLNSVGIICPHAKCNASLLNPMTLPGKVAFISQSRSLCEATLDHARRARVGFSHFVCVGSMLEVDFGDLINSLGSDPAVRSIVSMWKGSLECGNSSVPPVLLPG